MPEDVLRDPDPRPRPVERPVKTFRLWMTAYIARAQDRASAFERGPWLIG